MYGFSHDEDTGSAITIKYYFKMFLVKKACVAGKVLLLQTSPECILELQQNYKQTEFRCRAAVWILKVWFDLTVLKGADKSEFTASLMNIKSRTCQRTVITFLEISALILYDLFVERKDEHYNIAKLLAEKTCFQHYLYARYSKNEIFQLGSMPAGSS